MFRAEHLLVTLNRLAARKPEAMRHLEDFLVQDLPTLAPLAIDVAIEQGDPLGRALANVLTRAPDPELAFKLNDRIPLSTTALREAATVVAAQMIHSKLLPRDWQHRTIAKLKLVNRLAQSGQIHGALTHLQQLVPALETSFQKLPHPTEILLARAQHLYAGVLLHLRRFTEALHAIRRAITLYKSLNVRFPDQY
ncbi:MAG: hypothetical protein ACK56E_00135, partial [Planctomyces sp.]